MINDLYIKNFRSILNAHVTLQPLTVLVGANGSGKSNLIKAIEFISSIAQNGLLGAVDQFGSFKSIVPKAIPDNEISKIIVKINYHVALPRIESYKKKQPQFGVNHNMELTSAKTEAIRMRNELLEYENPIAVAEIYMNDFNDKKINKDILNSKSCFRLIRGLGGGIKYDGIPTFSEDLPRYLNWLGFPQMFQKTITSKTSFKKFLKKISFIGLGESSSWNRRYESFIDPNSSRYTGFAIQANIFNRTIRGMKRYDLLLNELRREQQAGNTETVATSGKNIPSVLRQLKSSGGKSWDRLLRTLSVIAPHVSNLDSNRLRTGKEFVEFTENVAKRRIESWESSDGTLRALAVLLALETHEADSTVLLEEPERNLHPWAVRAIIEHMREVITERNIQIILTTHSPQVLERVKPEEVLVVSRNTKSGTCFNKLQDILPNSKLVMGDVSRLWVKGLLGGVPADDS